MWLLASVVLSGCSQAVRLPVEDMTLAFAVRTALVNDADVGVAPIEVTTRDGIVTLEGRVATSAERDRVVSLARGVAGVRRVDSRITLGVDPERDESPQSGVAPTRSALPPPDPWPPGRHFAVGGAVDVSRMRGDALDGTWSLGPAFRFGRGSGLRPTLAIARLRSDLPPTAGTNTFGSLRQTLVVGGVAYAFTGERWSLQTTLAAGFSFNHIRLDPGPVVPADASLPVAADASLAFVPSVTLWHEISRRTSVGVTTGYIVTRPQASWLEGDRFVRRRLTADAVVVGVSAAFWVF